MSPPTQGFPEFANTHGPAATAENEQPIPRASRRDQLGTKATLALRYGATSGADSSRSAALRSAMVGMVNAGWSFNRIVDALLDRANAGGRKIQDLADRRGMAKAMALMRREYDSAVAYVRKHMVVVDRNGALLAVVEWREAVDRAVWRGQGQLTDRNTLHVAASAAQRLGSSTRFPLSVRRVAEESGVSAGTASRSLRRATANGWLRLVAPSDGSHPALYALSFPNCEVAATSPHTDLARELSQVLHFLGPSHDAWRWQALGKGPQRVYLFLSKVSTVAEIASQLGITKRAVYQHLATLRRAGLAQNHQHGHWTPTNKSLLDVAIEYGTHGIGDQQRQRHEQQRDGYHRYAETTSTTSGRARATS